MSIGICTTAWPASSSARPNRPIILHTFTEEYGFHLKPRRFSTAGKAMSAILKDQVQRANHPERNTRIDFHYDIIRNGESILESPISINALWKSEQERKMMPDYLLPNLGGVLR